jgi:hypothetical protein
MPVCPGTSPEPLSGTSALRLAVFDGEPIPFTWAGPDRPLGEVPAPVTVVGQQSFDPNVALDDVLLGGSPQ